MGGNELLITGGVLTKPEVLDRGLQGEFLLSKGVGASRHYEFKAISSGTDVGSVF